LTYLYRRGHTVIEAGTVAEAEEAMITSLLPVELIILDINLPDQTGWDLLRSLKIAVDQRRKNLATTGEQEPSLAHPKVIVITAVRPSVSRINDFQPDGLLIKPFPIGALNQLIAKTLGEAPLAEELETEE
jgi:CheY-like chemotaxis protein